MLEFRWFWLLLACALGCNREPQVAASPAPPLSAFVRLQGGQVGGIAPGSPLVTLDRREATWWAGALPVTLQFPEQIDERGARWSADGKSLRVGLGTLDLDTRTWSADPALQRWQTSGPRGGRLLIRAAWFEDEAHVAILDRPRSGAVPEIHIVRVADGSARSRRVLSQPSVLVTEGDRLLVEAWHEFVLLDLDAEILAVPKRRTPKERVRVRSGARMFAISSDLEPLELLRSTDAEQLATWDLRAADAVPVPGGVVAVDHDGTVFVGCLEGSTVRTTASAESGIRPVAIEVVGQHVVVAGYGDEHAAVVVAKIDSVCR